tara:strand:- start:292 stop:726 length:435 start_codon:yes stop_codon:yes gene_type:complete
MVEFKHYRGIGRGNEELEVTIASGPVIVEGGKVLLDKHGDDEFWKFPGGTHIGGKDFLDTARFRVKEELGIDVELGGEPCVLAFDRSHKGTKEYVLLIHYKAERKGEIKKGEMVREFDWFDVNSLPEDVALNIEPVLRYFKFIG